MNYDLVFEGGGAKGMVFVGAMQEFEARGHTFGRLLGTSAGAITATFLAAGYDHQEMLAALNEEEDGKPVFASFMGEPKEFTQEEIDNSATRAFMRKLDLPFVPNFMEEGLDTKLVNALMTQPSYRHIFSFVERGGWYIADRFLHWMRKKLDEGTFKGKPRQFSQMTLQEFHEATGVELTLVASDTTAEQILVLNHHTAPQCPVVWAVRMSMSIPLVWQEVEWQAEWGTYRDRDISGHLIVDGGMLSNFPIELLVSGQPEVTSLMGVKRTANIMGFLIDEALPVEGAPAKEAEEKRFELGSLRTAQRLSRLINTATTAHDKMVLEEFESLVVRLPAKDYGTTEFDMSEERRKALLAAGRRAMQEYLDRPKPVSSGTRSVSPLAGATRSADRLAAKFLQE